MRRARKLIRKTLQREGLLPSKPKPAVRFGAGPGRPVVLLGTKPVGTTVYQPMERKD